MTKYFVIFLLCVMVSPYIAQNVIKRFPKMVVFDLDRTLWPFWLDTHVDPPFHKNNVGQILDSRGRLINHYAESVKVLKYLKKNNISMSAASRTGEVKAAQQLLDLFGWNKYFKNKQIYPGSKDTHIREISEACKVNLDDILFFDDEFRNIEDLERVGVVSVFVRNGMSMKLLLDGLNIFANKKSPDYKPKKKFNFRDHPFLSKHKI